MSLIHGGVRFVPTRAGIINLWDYRDQEFCFADGRLVLRGPNGSGKTKALEVLFPFVLDGRIEPRRLNPFAGEERTMKSNLLYRKQDSAYSYVWMEFARGRWDDPEVVTIGIGMRATRSSDKVTRWYFVADGRVGVDFSLIDPEDRPFTRKQLAEQIGTDSIVDRPVDYRNAIDARMFGLGAQRYDQLITLILTLRRPQLAKHLDPRGLSQALTGGLRPLDEQLILDAARSFSDMEDVGRTLEGLAQADTATKAFVTIYRKYLAVQTKTDVEQVRARLDAATTASTGLFAATTLRERRETERTAAEARAEDADRAYEQANADRENLQRSTAYEGKQQLDDLTDAVRRLQLSAEVHADKANTAYQTLEHRTHEAEHARTALDTATATLTKGEDELRTAAEDAGITWTPLPEPARIEQLTTTVRGHAEERDADVRAVRHAVAAVETAATERARAERLAERAHAQLDTTAAEIAHTEAAVELARSTAAHALRSWWDEHRAIYTPLGDDLFDALHAAVADAGSDAPTVAEVLAERTGPLLESLRAQRQEARTRSTSAAARSAELTAERERVIAEHDDAPPLVAARSGRTGTYPGAPLWRLVRFADEVPPETAAAVEAALEAANLLDGWVCPDGELPADYESDQFLVPLPVADRPTGRTLADVLVIVDDSDSCTVPKNTVADLLDSIALPESAEAPSGAVSIAAGGFRQGVQLGRHRKAAVEFIGATARAERREHRAAELTAALAAADDDRHAAERHEADLTTELARLGAATKALPRPSAVTAALRAVAETAGMMRSRSETCAQAEHDLDRAVAELSTAEKKLREAATAHRTPRTHRELDALAAAIRHFENIGAGLLRLRGEHRRAHERAEESEDRRTEAADLAEVFAEEAAAAHSGYQEQVRKLETLRAALGASATDIDHELAQAGRRIEATRAERKAARKAADAAIEAVGDAEAAYRATHESLATALTEVRTAVQTLAPYAQPDLLTLLGAPAEHRWPSSDAAWSTPEQLLYRITAAGPNQRTPLLPGEVAALFDSLTAATATVHASETARKSTRSATTAALQEFDAALAGCGHDYRLRWDAADGLTVVQVDDEHGCHSLSDFATRVDTARRDQEQLLTAAEQRILEDALLTGLAQQIHERTSDARELIARMGAEMKRRRMSSGNTIGVHWLLADQLSDPARAMCKLMDRDVSTLTAEDLATIRAHLAGEIRAARAAHPERSYPEILAATLDYRTWRVFSFTLITTDGTEDRLTVARHSALSGGEQSVSLHLPLFAAAHVMLDSADPQAPRLLALDEAFAGVDDNGRSELLGLSVQFDLDLFMTGYDLWITYPHVPACAHYDLAHSAAEHTVSATLLVWDSGDILAGHDGTELTAALGSPDRRRIPSMLDGGLELVPVT
ncbi:TIGR02680 family protein [Nocardia sp. 004]|uniref:TIGR02680 family protein n=1 Tax=Nocardia sp. 004 TaxID=3385978 RepID=UPI00399FF216